MKSESIKEIAAGLARAQGAMKGAIKDSTNPFYKSKYADLASIVEAIRTPFSENGLSYIQIIEPSEKEEVRVKTVLLHSSGEWLDCGVLAVPVAKQDAQGFGSALTYARRYSLSAACGIAPDDDDGNAALKAAPKKPQISESTIEDCITAMKDADTMETLKDIYMAACKEALGEQSVIKKFTMVKDACKDILEKRNAG